jgi:nucleoside-triphosphatase THEP1
MARWAVMSGPKGSGKSTHALDLAARLRAKGLRVAGFVQVGRTDELDRKGYDLLRLTDGSCTPLARPGGAERDGTEQFCSWTFDAQAFRTACDWVYNDAAAADVIIMDEVSKLEAAGRGHHDIIVWSLGLHERKVVVLCVRSDQLFYVVEKFALEEGLVGDMEVPSADAAKDEFAETIALAIRGN